MPKRTALIAAAVVALVVLVVLWFAWPTEPEGVGGVPQPGGTGDVTGQQPGGTGPMSPEGELQSPPGAVNPDAPPANPD